MEMTVAEAIEALQKSYDRAQELMVSRPTEYGAGLQDALYMALMLLKSVSVVN